MAPGDGAAQRPVVAHEVLLADELVEGARSHPRRERLPLWRRTEQGALGGAGSTGGHDPSLRREAATAGPRRSGQILMTPATSINSQSATRMPTSTMARAAICRRSRRT